MNDALVPRESLINAGNHVHLLEPYAQAYHLDIGDINLVTELEMDGLVHEL